MIYIYIINFTCYFISSNFPFRIQKSQLNLDKFLYNWIIFGRNTMSFDFLLLYTTFPKSNPYFSFILLVGIVMKLL